VTSIPPDLIPYEYHCRLSLSVFMRCPNYSLLHDWRDVSR